MCVALPGKVVSVGSGSTGSLPGRVLIDGVERSVDLVMTPSAAPGDFVITHSGYAIRVVDRDEARATLDLVAGSADHIDD